MVDLALMAFVCIMTLTSVVVGVGATLVISKQKILMDELLHKEEKA